jgi:hypothetical protein
MVARGPLRRGDKDPLRAANSSRRINPPARYGRGTDWKSVLPPYCVSASMLNCLISTGRTSM